MQDFFKYDKLQQGASLFMKSDHDGDKDAQNRGLPLGIKSTAQGIEHFTNWDNISNSLQERDSARFDDMQPTSLDFGMVNIRGGGFLYEVDEVGNRIEAEEQAQIENIMPSPPINTPTSFPGDTPVNPEVKDIKDIVGPAEGGLPDPTEPPKEKTQTNSPPADPKLFYGVSATTMSQNFHLSQRDAAPRGDVEKYSLHFTDTWEANDITILDDLAFVSYEKYSDVHRADENLSNLELRQTIEAGQSLTYDAVPVSVERVSTMHLKVADSSDGKPVWGALDTIYAGKNTSNQASFRNLTLNLAAYHNTLLKIEFDGKIGGQVLLFGTGSIAVENGSADIVGTDTAFTTEFAAGDDFHIVDRLGVMYLYTIGSVTDDTNLVLTSNYAQATRAVVGPYASRFGKLIDTPDTLYFMYGGVLEDQSPGSQPYSFSYPQETNVDIGDLLQIDSSVADAQSFDYPCFVTHQDAPRPNGYFSAQSTIVGDPVRHSSTMRANSNKKVAGYFYTVIDNEKNNYGEPANIGIQLDMACIRGGFEVTGAGSIPFSASDGTELEEWWSAGFDGDGSNTTLLDFVVGTKSIKLIKIQPVRKCGKVDIYTRKKGIITAAVGNRLTSPGHNLNTNDIIDISSALFDGSQNSYADIHPLNGKRFVKKIDDDTFDVYDDQFFEDPADTLYLKTTDGVNWICVSNDFGSLGQSWDYYGTMTSPTGRNGYNRFNSDDRNETLATTDSFLTTKRIPKIDPIGNQDTTDPINSTNGGTVSLRFEGLDNTNEPINTYINSYFARNIDENIPTSLVDPVDSYLPRGSDINENLGAIGRAPQDFYPYFCQDEDNVTKENANSYWGSRFGCSLDFKFSHMSGDSKVYMLAVGERGSDVSIDLYGVGKDESRIDSIDPGASDAPSYNEWLDGDLRRRYRQRIIPSYGPYGKVHVIQVTVDKYNRITNMSHENTLFGGGAALKMDATLSAVIDPSEGTKYNYIENNPGAAFSPSPSSAVSEKVLPLHPLGEEGYFEELQDLHTTKYWIRAATMHWFPQDRGDYHSSTVGGPMVPARVFPVQEDSNSSMWRGEQLTMGTAANSKSRFGDSGFSLNPNDIVTYRRINRFEGHEGSLWYIFPWVDSFGKSVAIKTNTGLSSYSSSTSKLVVLAGSTTRSNIEISNSVKQPTLIYDAAAEYSGLPARFLDYQGRDDGVSALSLEETKSQIGQVTAHFINYTDSNWKSVFISEFNKGGAVSTSSDGRLSKAWEDTEGNTFSVKYLKMPEGYSAGEGVAEVIASAHLSASDIMWEDDLIFWADQRLYDSVSTINVLKFEDDTFKANTTIDKGFTSGRSILTKIIGTPDYISGNIPPLSRAEWAKHWLYGGKNDGSNVGDGFGWGIRYHDRLLVTNSMDTTTELENDIGAFLGDDTNTRRLDFLQVYERSRSNVFSFDQKISATFDKRDTNTYPEILVHQFRNYLLSLDNVTYRNDLMGSTTWDIRLLGRYDTADKKIILKDPVEYSLFGRDYSAAGVTYNPTLSEPYTEELDPYLYFREEYISNSSSNNGAGYLYYDYSKREDGIHELLDESNVRPKNYGGIKGGTKFAYSNTYSQVFFLNVPMIGIDDIQDLTVTFKVNPNNSYFKTIDCETGNIEGTTTNDSILVPKIVLYRKDPRSMIIPNGPVNAGTYNNFPKYVDGTWTTTDAASTGDATKFPPHFRGGANDLHFYGSLPGSAPLVNDTTIAAYKQHYYGGSQTLGELYDATFNKAGNTNRGIPSWSAPDVAYYLNADQIESMMPYGTLYTTASVISNVSRIMSNTYSVTIPKSVVREYLIRGSLIKSDANNRSLFSTFDRLYHGVPNSWTRSYDDINQPSYRNITGNIDNTLVVGFILTTVESVDINTKSLSYTTTGWDTDLGVNALRAVELSSRASERAKSKYPYAPTVAITDTNVDNKFAQRDKFVEFELSSTIEDPEFSITKQILPPRRFANKFHKVAIFQYNNSTLNEVQKNYLRSQITKDYFTGSDNETQQMLQAGGEGPFWQYISDPIARRQYFGVDPFAPLPLGVSDGNNGFQTLNPIIRFGQSTASAEVTGGGKGVFSKALQILNTENLAHDDTSYYVDGGSLVYNPSPSGSFLGQSFFNKSTMLGGFDIQEPEYLSLFMQSFPPASGKITLFTEGHIVDSGLMPLNVVGVEFANSSLPLWIGCGARERTQDAPLYLLNMECRNALSLYTYETAPASNISIYTKGPSVTGDFPLTFAPSTTGTMPLNILGPLPYSGNASLFARGSGAIAGQTELSISGIFLPSGNMPLYISGLGIDNASTTLVMNAPQSGSVPLFVRAPVMSSGVAPLITVGRGINSGVAPLFIGDQFDVWPPTSTVSAVTGNVISNIVSPFGDPAATTLFVKSQSYNSGQATLLTDGYIYTANSNNNGNGSVQALIRNGLFDLGASDGSGREAAVIKTLNNVTYSSNSINGNTLQYNVYNNNRMSIDSDSVDQLWYMGSRIPKRIVYTGEESIGHVTKTQSADPSLITLMYSDDDNSSNAFYKHNNIYNSLTKKNTVIRQDAYDANGEYLVKAGMRGNTVEIGMYTINSDGSVSQEGAKGTESTLRTNPSLESNTTNDLGHGIIDPFYTLRTDIYNYITTNYNSGYKTYDIDKSLSQVTINDLKISKYNRCAISLRVKVSYERDTTITTTFDVILTFKISGYGGVYSGFANSSDYSWTIFEESGENQFKQDAAYNVEFDKEDIYFDRRSATWGEIWKLSQSDNYTTAVNMIKFSDLSDSQLYTKATNALYITEERRLVGFGAPFKIFDEYNVSGGKIMFVGATLFDPYVFNDLTNPYFPNAMGAVYIYRRAGNASTWSYEGAVYAKGYTSDNILANLSQYRNSTLANNQYSLFGYDFDYYEGNLVVSEPGGNGTKEIGAGRAYLFDVTSTPTLITTYLGSSISLPDGATLDAGDNFGSSIVLPGKSDPITWSDATITQEAVPGFVKFGGDSTIYNLRSKEVFGFTYETVDGALTYTDANLKYETNPYDLSHLSNGECSLSENITNRWSRILSIKRLNFGNTQKLGVVREFVVRPNSPYHNNDQYSFRLQKLSILNLQRVVDGTLFIKGPNTTFDSMDMYASGIGAPSANIPLIMPTFDIASGVTTLYINQVGYDQQPYIPLHINQVTTPNIPLHISGVANSYSDSMKLNLPHVLPEAPLTLFMPSIGHSSGNVTLQVDGSVGIGVVNTAPLLIGKDAHINSGTPLFLQSILGAYTPGADLYSGKTDLYMSGTPFAPVNSGTPFYINAPLSGIDTLSSPLHIETFIPPIGPGGGYVRSGVFSIAMSGNNDAGTFWPQNQASTLYLRANPYASGVTTLYINKPFVDTAPLYMKALDPGTMPLSVSGAFISTNNTSLYTYAPPNTGITLFTYGYRE